MCLMRFLNSILVKGKTTDFTKVSSLGGVDYKDVVKIHKDEIDNFPKYREQPKEETEAILDHFEIVDKEITSFEVKEGVS